MGHGGFVNIHREKYPVNDPTDNLTFSRLSSKQDGYVSYRYNLNKGGRYNSILDWEQKAAGLCITQLYSILYCTWMCMKGFLHTVFRKKIWNTTKLITATGLKKNFDITPDKIIHTVSHLISLYNRHNHVATINVVWWIGRIIGSNTWTTVGSHDHHLPSTLLKTMHTLTNNLNYFWISNSLRHY